MTGQPKENPPPQRRREIRRTILVLALLAAGTFAAWQAGVFVSRRIGRHTRGASSAANLPAQTQPAPDACSPGDLLRSPLAAVGLTPLDGDPGGIAPPAGSKRREAFQRRIGGRTEQRARYELAGAIGAAADYYARALAARGFVRRPDGAAARGGRTMVFVGDAAAATVRLNARPAGGKMVEAVVTVVRQRRGGP